MSQHLFSLLMKKTLTPNQYYVLWSCKQKISPTILTKEEIMKTATELRSLGYLDGENKITSSGDTILVDLEGVFKKVKPKTTTEILGTDFTDQINKYRKKFPVGKKATPQEVLDKFLQLFQTNPDMSWEYIQLATDLYFSEQRDEQYIMKAGNFIKVDRSGSTVYTLSEYYERVLSGERPGDSSVDPMLNVF